MKTGHDGLVGSRWLVEKRCLTFLICWDPGPCHQHWMTKIHLKRIWIRSEMVTKRIKPNKLVVQITSFLSMHDKQMMLKVDAQWSIMDVLWVHDGQMSAYIDTHKTLTEILNAQWEILRTFEVAKWCQHQTKSLQENLADQRWARSQPRYLRGPCKLLKGPEIAWHSIAWHFLLNFRGPRNI